MPAGTNDGRGARPAVAILREEGCNSQFEMAHAFSFAGFEAVDVHMSDLLGGRRTLEGFRGLAACGGFSYGDVLGVGEGWAKSALFHAGVRAELERFFARPDTFVLGVCNGCQMLSALREIVPGAEAWPRFVTNRSERFEARLSQVEMAAAFDRAGFEAVDVHMSDLLGGRRTLEGFRGLGVFKIQLPQYDSV